MWSFDGVVLAAGAGTRLRGVMPPFFKPLMTVDGKSLIVSAVAASRDNGAARTFVVVAPGNADPICAVLDDAGLLNTHHVTFIVQPRPAGPADAVERVIRFVKSDYTLLLMADNVFSAGDIEHTLQHAPDKDGVTIGTGLVEREQAHSFTRVNEHGDCFEGPIKDVSRETAGGSWQVWLGPVLADTNRLHDILTKKMGVTIDGEAKLGPLFNDFRGGVKTVPCHTHDVGDLNGKWREDSDPR